MILKKIQSILNNITNRKQLYLIEYIKIQLEVVNYANIYGRNIIAKN